MDRTLFIVVPFAFLPATTVPVFLDRDNARSYMEQHVDDELRMIALCHVQLSSLTVPFCVVNTLEDFGVKVHAVLASPVLAVKREQLPVTENRPVIVSAELHDLQQRSAQCA